MCAIQARLRKMDPFGGYHRFGRAVLLTSTAFLIIRSDIGWRYPPDARVSLMNFITPLLLIVQYGGGDLSVQSMFVQFKKRFPLPPIDFVQLPS